ncbi:carboxypeptidase-like regulatory domain-containing protein [Amycolatopsis sp. 195334CR]|uniref:carboxypeptidase-like regulatory domain-containing protein n=1 Tax=Amycolatopsis sp. 195334CR TaxID=2814588 RepID=UPI001A8D964A|nr:carboxypeptidase-like regulatory domain-containing protein [Amycolatopsis sp. 195334CR]MBN6039100.1 carboxypeptidase regulatory-like domain-containing protein [Amycolatopsis sp. 195334CR]
MLDRRHLRAVTAVFAAFTLLLGLSTVPAAAAETGTISGSYVRGPGRPIASAGVRLDDRDNNQKALVSTDAEGRYRFDDVPAGQYELRFYGPGVFDQYWPRQTDPYQAGVVTVTAGEETVVDETAIPLGDVEVEVTDEVSGEPLAGVSVFTRGGPHAGSISATTDAEGVARFGPLRAATWEFGLSKTGYQYDVIGETVVRADETTRLTKALAKEAVLTVDFTDAATGAPVGNACVYIMAEHERSVSPDHMQCAYGTGKLRLTAWFPGRYRLFAVAGNKYAGDGVHGSQWVGAHGGTGDLEQARWVELRSGETSDVQVRFDGVGAISGVVTGADNGAPVSGLCPTVTPAYSWHHQPWGVTCTYTDGRYTISGLGPYDWRVQFPDMTGKYAWQWSGAKADRFAATPVRVTAGATAPLDARLEPAGKVTGRIHGATLPAYFLSVNAYNAATGDPAGPDGRVESTFDYELSGLDTQQIRISFVATQHVDWYPEPVSVVAGQTRAGLDLHATPGQ